jgi:hypothetical protein
MPSADTPATRLATRLAGALALHGRRVGDTAYGASAPCPDPADT